MRTRGEALRRGWLPPGANVVGRLLADLFGREVTAEKKVYRPMKSAVVVGSFVDDEGALRCACALELALAANLGAALTMMPTGVADESSRASKLDAVLLENVAEVLNIGSRWFMLDESVPHVKLDSVYQTDVPDPLRNLLAKPPRKQAYDVQLHGYRGGVLALLSR